MFIKLLFMGKLLYPSSGSQKQSEWPQHWALLAVLQSPREITNGNSPLHPSILSQLKFPKMNLEWLVMAKPVLMFKGEWRLFVYVWARELTFGMTWAHALLSSGHRGHVGMGEPSCP